MTPRLWLSLASAAFVACPPFCVLELLVSNWRYVKWISVDAAEFWDASGMKRYRIGMFDPVGGGRALMCPNWVNTQLVAELYGVWMLIQCAVKRNLPQVVMLQDNLQAIWANVNLKSRAHFWRHNRILRARVLHIKNSGLILHSVWVPSAYQPADPLSRIRYFSER